MLPEFQVRAVAGSKMHCEMALLLLSPWARVYFGPGISAAILNEVWPIVLRVGQLLSVKFQILDEFWAFVGGRVATIAD